VKHELIHGPGAGVLFRSFEIDRNLVHTAKLETRGDVSSTQRARRRRPEHARRSSFTGTRHHAACTRPNLTRARV
jgi:hypothetical protein